MLEDQLALFKGEQRQAIQPLWAAKDWKSEKGFLAWFLKALPILERIHEPRIRDMQLYQLWYTGEYDSNIEYRMIIPGRTPITLPGYMVPVVINHLYDLTEQRVSRLSKFRPTFDVAPTNDEESDRIGARNMKTILDSISRKNKADFFFQDAERWNAVFGEDLIGVEWDASSGDIGEDGKPIGDVVFNNKEPFYVLYEPKVGWRKINYLIEIYDIMHVDEARKKFKDSSIEPDKNSQIYSFQGDNEIAKEGDQIIVYRFIHKPTEYMENGCEAYVVGNKVKNLETKKYRYSHNQLPYVRMTDIDLPGRAFPVSSYKFLVPIQHQYNKMVSMAHKAITLAAHPKWFMTKGACNIKSLGNLSTIVETKPGMPFPQLVAFNPVSRDVIEYKENMRSELQTISGIQGVSRGNPPPGARAESMLRFYEEQEELRSSTTVIKHNEAIRDVFSMAGSVAGDYYPQNPERLVRTLGTSNRFLIKKMSEIRVSTQNEVIVQNSTGFSESKEGRREEIKFLMEAAPGLVTPDMVADIYEISSPQKFYDVATAALSSAQAENQAFLNGEPVAEPKSFEDLIVHYRTHLIMIQSPTYKLLPKIYQDAIEAHMLATEMLMEDAKIKNPAFSQLLMQFPYYPMFMPVDPASLAPPMPPEAQMMPPMEGAPPPEAMGPPPPSPMDIMKSLNGQA